MNKLETTLGALVLSTVAACGTPQDPTTRVLSRHVSQKVSALYRGDCTAEQTGDTQGMPAKITCENSTTAAYFNTTALPNGDTHFSYTFGVQQTPQKNSLPQRVEMAVAPNGECHSLTFDHIQTKSTAPEFTSMECDDEGCTVTDTRGALRDELSPEDKQDVCQLVTVLMRGMQRAVDTRTSTL